MFSENFDKICRTCLENSCSMKNLFSQGQNNSNTYTIGEMLRTCTSLEIYQGDGLPDQLCHTCLVELTRTFMFIKLCKKSDTALRSFSKTNAIGLFDQHDIHKQDYSWNAGDQIQFETGNNINNTKINELTLQEGTDSECIRSQHLFLENNHCDTSKTTEIGSQLFDVCAGLGPYNRHTGEIHKNTTKNVSSQLICKPIQLKEASILNTNEELSNTSHDKQVPVTKRTKGNKNLKQVKKSNLPRTCTICNKTFRFHSNLKRHTLTHTGERPYLCNVCGKGFAQMSYLKIHSFIHSGQKPYQCQMCERSFSAPGTLNTHIRTHTGERPHICKICGKDFPQSGYLAAHIRTHTGEKPAECKVCHRRFNQRGRLIDHMRIHSGEKPYSCAECGRNFAVKGTLKKHMRTHTGERPYICSACGQAFAQSGTLATHMKIHTRPK